MPKLYYQGAGAITEPIVNKPAQFSRKQWREILTKSRREMKRRAKAEARRPESEKIDERLHAAGLISPRDARAIRPIHFDTHILGA
jgi:hypothetical protein